MDIQYRKNDIIKLRANISQDFMKMVLKDGWKDVLYNLAFENRKSDIASIKAKYKPIYNKIMEVGEDKFDVFDLDVTALNELCQTQEIKPYIKGNASKVLKRLNDDRNLTNHSSENETDEDLYIRYIICLNNIKEFLEKIHYDEFEISDEQKTIFIKKYNLKIKPLMNLIIKECGETIGIKEKINKEIEKLVEIKLNHKHVLLKEFLTRYNNYKTVNHDDAMLFAKVASDKNIVSIAHDYAAEYFISKKDYIEAEKRILAAIDSHIKEICNDKKELFSIADMPYFARKLYSSYKSDFGDIEGLEKLNSFVASLGCEPSFEGEGNDMYCFFKKINN